MKWKDHVWDTGVSIGLLSRSVRLLKASGRITPRQEMHVQGFSLYRCELGGDFA